MTLTQYISAWGSEPFNWADRTCVHFVAGWAKERLQRDVLAGLPLPLPDSPLGWARLVRMGGGIRTLIEQAVGSGPIPSACAMDGDLVLFRGEQTGWTLGICNGRLSIVPSDSGLTFLNTLDAEMAWKL